MTVANNKLSCLVLLVQTSCFGLAAFGRQNALSMDVKKSIFPFQNVRQQDISRFLWTKIYASVYAYRKDTVYEKVILDLDLALDSYTISFVLNNWIYDHTVSNQPLLFCTKLD